MNPADVLAMPAGLLDEMNAVISDENRARAREQRRAARRRGR